MVSERIPMVALHLAGNVTPYMADVLSRVRGVSSDGVAILIEQAFERAKDDLDVDLVRSLMGRIDNDWVRESLVSATQLCNESIYVALKNRALLDRRRTTRTRRKLLDELVNNHIREWSAVRGIGGEK